MHALLKASSDNYGAAPRRMSVWDRWTYFRVPKPKWLRHDDLQIHFRNLEAVFTNGIVTWGAVVQANGYLWTKNRHNCPAEIMFSMNKVREIDPMILQGAARRTFDLKGTQPSEPQLRFLANYLANERIRVFGAAVPSEFSGSLRCKISTTFVCRKHLPGRRLCKSLFPVIANRREPFVITPLPARFWPEELVQWWLS